MQPLVVCIRTDRTSIEAVAKLRDGVVKHLAMPHQMICLTDQPEQCDGVLFIDIKEMGLPGSWARLLLFEPQWRGAHKIIYFDLGVSIVGDLSPLAGVPGEFSACGSSVMVIGGNMAGFVWVRFSARQQELMARHQGDEQACIEELYPHVVDLRRIRPKGFFTASGSVTLP